MSSFQQLPEYLLLQFSRLLYGEDLISFSFSCQTCFRLSWDSTSFWKHDVFPGLLVAASPEKVAPGPEKVRSSRDTMSKGGNQFTRPFSRVWKRRPDGIVQHTVLADDRPTNMYREAAFRRWRFRRLISGGGDASLRKTRVVIGNYLGQQISEVIVPGTHYLLALATCSHVKKLVCFDLQLGTRMEVEGNVEPGSFKIDATRGAKETFNILVVSPCYFDVYEGVLKDKPSSEGRILQLRRVARKQCLESDLGNVQKITLEGYYIIVETGSHLPGLRGPSSFHIMNWSPSSPDREAIVWRNETAQRVYDWHAVGDLLLVTHTQFIFGGECRLYALSFKTLQEACGLGLSLAPPPTPYPSVQGWTYAAVDHMVIDHTHIVERSDGSVDLSIIVTGYANDRPDYSSVNVCGLSSRVTLEEIAKVAEDNRRGILLLGPSKRYGDKVELSIPPNSVHFTLPKYVKTAKINDGVFWCICDNNGAAIDRRKKLSSADLYVSDTTHSSNVKAIKGLPAGNVHLVDMDVGVVCTVQITGEEDKVETKILIDWYS